MELAEEHVVETGMNHTLGIVLDHTADTGGIAMEKLSQEAEKIMAERFGKDSIIALATSENNMPYVRSVNAFYADGSFFILTYGLSNKMKQIEKNPVVAIAGDWFTAHGRGVNLGYFEKKENADIAAKMRSVFVEWIDNGHNNFEDENTCILKIELTEGYCCHMGQGMRLIF